MIIKLSLYSLFLFFLINISLFADLSAADSLLKEGKKEEAVKIYKEWLTSHPDSENFTEILVKTAENISDIHRSIDLLKKYLPATNDTVNQRLVLTHLGWYEELLGNISNAQDYYERAAYITASGTEYTLLLCSANLLQYLGEYGKSELQLLEILKNSKNKKIQGIAYLLLAKSYLLRDEIVKLDVIIRELQKIDEPVNPQIAYFLENLGKNDYLSRELSKSPEYLILSGKIKKLPDVENVFGFLNLKKHDSKEVEQNIGDFYIQTGSFKDPDNAEYMSRDLEKLGFYTTIDEQTIQGTIYYKVLIKAASAEEVPNLILKLKDKGYEGYPIY